MGWTSYHAEHYNSKGEVDRKAECDKLWTQREHDGYPELEVLRSTVVGAVYYGAVAKRRGGVTEKVFAVIVLTNINSRDYFNFSYKDFGESAGCGYNKCPASILDLLTPTDDEEAMNWRQECRDYLKKRSEGKTLDKLPVGTTIRFTRWDGTEYECVKMAPNYQFRKTWWYVPKTNTYIPSRRIPKEGFTIVEKEEFAV